MFVIKINLTKVKNIKKIIFKRVLLEKLDPVFYKKKSFSSQFIRNFITTLQNVLLKCIFVSLLFFLFFFLSIRPKHCPFSFW